LHALKVSVEFCCRSLAGVKLFYYYCFHPVTLSVL